MYRCFGSQGVLNSSSRPFILDCFISLALMIILGVGEVFANDVPTFTYQSTISHVLHNAIPQGGPAALAFNNNGDLYVVYSVSNEISRFNASNLGVNPTGADQTYTPAGFTFANVFTGLALDNNNNFYVSDYEGNTVSAFNITTGLAPNGVTNPIMSGLNNPAGLAFDSTSGKLYVANRNTGNSINGGTISVFNGRATSTFATGLSEPSGLAFDSVNGNLYVTNYVSGNIYAYDVTTGAVPNGINNPIVSGLSGPYGLTVDPNKDYLYVVSVTDGSIRVYKTDGTFVTSFGSRGTGDSQFIGALFVAINPDGTLMAVSESENPIDVKIYSISYPQPVPPAPLPQPAPVPAPFIPPVPPGFMPPPGTPPGKGMQNLTPPQMTNLVDSTVGAASNRAGIASGVSNTIALLIPSAVTVALNNIVNAGEMAPGAFRPFTPSQRHALKRLNQQLPMLQFQSLQSMIEPITGPVTNSISATPFDQTKSTIEPLFLANDNNHVWVQPYAGLQRLESYDQVIGYSLKTAGTVMGIGGKITSEIIMGVVMGGSLNSYSQDRTTGDGGVKNYYGGLYWSYAKPEGGFHTDASAIVGKSHYTADRNISALGLVAKSAHDGWDASGRIQTGYKLMFGDLSVDPYTSVGARYSYQNSYQETNAYPFNLKMPSSMTKTGIVEIGMKFQHSMVIDESMISPFLSLSALRLHPLSRESQSRVSFVDGGNAFSVPISTQVKTYATATIGCASILASNVSLSTLVTGKIRKHEKSIEALVKVSYAF